MTQRRRQAIFAAAIAIGVGTSLAAGAAPARSAASPSASSNQTGAAAVAPNESKLDQTPKPYENAKRSLKLSAPAYWKPYTGGNSDDILFCFMIPPDPTAMRTAARQSGERVVFFGDDFRFEMNPLIDVKAKPEALADDARAAIKNQNPEAAFKPVEKLKVAGLDGVAVTATVNGETKDEGKVIVRHILFARDGMLFDMELRSHPYSIGKSAAQMLALARSIQFAAPPAPAESLTKLYEYKDRSIQFTAPSGWTSAIACHDFTCNGSYAALEIPTDPSTLPPRKPGSHRIIHPSGIILAAAPAKDPAGNLDAAVDEVKATAKAQDPTVEFKSVERTKLGGVDAVLLTTTSAGEKSHEEPQRVQRRFIALADGKIHQLMHASHDYSVKKETPVVDAILATVRFGAIAAAASGGTAYTFKEQNIAYTMPAGWTSPKSPPAQHAVQTLDLNPSGDPAKAANWSNFQFYFEPQRKVDDALKAFVDKRKSATRFEEVPGAKGLGVAGEPARLLRGSGLSPNSEDVRSLLVVTEHAGGTYFFWFQVAKEDLLPQVRDQANQILKSVKWLDGVAPAPATPSAAAPAADAAPKPAGGDGLE
jgi:hypothetical protein